MSLLGSRAAASKDAERAKKSQGASSSSRPSILDLSKESMGLDAATAAEVAAVVALAVLIVAIVAASAGACACAAGRAAVHDVELAALGEATLVTYEQASRAADRTAARQPPAAEEEKEETRERCALCLSEYAAAGELVRVVPACGHFFHADCGVDGWLRKRGTCPLCRGGVSPLPRPPRPECPPLPARARRATA